MDLKHKIKKLEGRHLKFGGAKNLHKLNIACKKLELHEISKIQLNTLYLKQCYATKSPQSIMWLQWKLNKKISSRYIMTLKIKEHNSSSKSSDILAEFTNFYKALYSSSNPSLEKIQQFLQKYRFF